MAQTKQNDKSGAANPGSVNQKPIRQGAQANVKPGVSPGNNGNRQQVMSRSALAQAISSNKPPVVLDVSMLRRRRSLKEEEEPEEDTQRERYIPVSAGAVEKALDLAFNPSREKLPEVTVIDKYQGRLFPIISLINVIWDDVIQIATYRMNKDEYKRIYGRSRPVFRNWLDDLLYSTAQWQKSIGGANLTKITDIALAEVETRAGEEGDLGSSIDVWGKE